MSAPATDPAALADAFRPGLFAGRRAIVTGGTSGIGLGTAQFLASLGARVTAVGLAAADAPASDGVQFVDLDLTDGAGAERLFAGIETLDILVNAAGIGFRLTEFDLPVFERVIAVNLTAAMRASTLARAALRRSGAGSIVNLSSMYATFGSAESPAYASSKGGIDQLTRSLAVAWAADGIRVNAVAPGWIDTPLTVQLQEDEPVNASIVGRTPAARWGTAAEIGAAIAFLCSPAARFVNGITLPVDGGYLCV